MHTTSDSTSPESRHSPTSEASPSNPQKTFSKFSIESLVSKDEPKQSSQADRNPRPDSRSSGECSPLPPKSSSPPLHRTYESRSSPGLSPRRSPVSWHTPHRTAPNLSPFLESHPYGFHHLKRSDFLPSQLGTTSLHHLAASRVGFPPHGLGISSHPFVHGHPQNFLSGLHHSAAASHNLNPLLSGSHPGQHGSGGILSGIGSGGMVNPGIGREPFGSLYPWLLARNRMLATGHRFPGGDYTHTGFLFHSPFRKPKRIRTAFSPSQLLRLEQAFEKNHYVVGAERKQLAASLNLSETQVKVWFQNRRTKYKRIKAEEEGEDEPKKKGSHHVTRWQIETHQS